jgi:hypothetical protein
MNLVSKMPYRQTSEAQAIYIVQAEQLPGNARTAVQKKKSQGGCDA